MLIWAPFTARRGPAGSRYLPNSNGRGAGGVVRSVAAGSGEPWGSIAAGLRSRGWGCRGNLGRGRERRPRAGGQRAVRSSHTTRDVRVAKTRLPPGTPAVSRHRVTAGVSCASSSCRVYGSSLREENNPSGAFPFPFLPLPSGQLFQLRSRRTLRDLHTPPVRVLKYWPHSGEGANGHTVTANSGHFCPSEAPLLTQNGGPVGSSETRSREK